MSRPERYAAVIVGPPADEVAAWTKPDHIVRTPKGTVVLGDRTVAAKYHEKPKITIYEVSHFLDDDSFSVSWFRGMKTAIYEVPATRNVFGFDLMPNVEGETEPRAIARKLGIPEDFLFPS